MKYIIIGYTSDIDIKTNSAKIRYAVMYPDQYDSLRLTSWTDDLRKATKLNNRQASEHFALSLSTQGIKAVSYGIEDNK